MTGGGQQCPPFVFYLIRGKRFCQLHRYLYTKQIKVHAQVFLTTQNHESEDFFRRVSVN